MTITIKDIAEAAGVSTMTVSRVLNNSKLVSDVTKNKIIKLMEEYNYQLNYSAKSLVLNKTFNIGVFFSSITNDTSSSFFAACVRGVANKLPLEYNLVIKQIHGLVIPAINPKRYDGIIIVSQKREDEDLIRQIHDLNRSIVVINRKTEITGVNNIYVDEIDGAKMATNALIGATNKKLLMLNGSKEIQSSQDRETGFWQAVDSAKLKRADIQVIYAKDFSFSSGYHTMQEFLVNNRCPDGVFAANDELALGALKSLSENHYDVPSKCKLIGFNNSEVSQFANPGLSTIDKPIMFMAELATTSLLEIIENNNFSTKTKILPTSFIKRATL